MGVEPLRQRVLWWGLESLECLLGLGRLLAGPGFRRGRGIVRRGRIFLRPGCRVWLFDRVSGWERDRARREDSVALSERGTA
jgi:hypothetical protein